MSAAGADITEHICIIRIWMNFWKRGLARSEKGTQCLSRLPMRCTSKRSWKCCRSSKSHKNNYGNDKVYRNDDRNNKRVLPKDSKYAIIQPNVKAVIVFSRQCQSGQREDAIGWKHSYVPGSVEFPMWAADRKIVSDMIWVPVYRFVWVLSDDSHTLRAMKCLCEVYSVYFCLHKKQGGTAVDSVPDMSVSGGSRIPYDI